MSVSVDPVLYEGRPAQPREPAEERCYDALDALGIAYRRVDHEAAFTIEACAAVEAVLGAPICKNLFLTNRQQTEFFLLLMPGRKPFKTKYLSAQIGSARMSFASPEHMRALLGLEPGSVSVLGLLNDRERRVHLLVDAALLQDEWLGCHPCRNTSTLRIAMHDVTERILPHLGYAPTVVTLPDSPE